MLKQDTRIFVAGHRGMVGSALMRALGRGGFTNLIVCERQKLDLTCQEAVEDFFQREKPEVVFHAAARVGGIHANRTFPADFLYQNLAIATHVIHAAWRNKVRRLLFLGSTCIYPKHAPQPIPESALLTGPLEETNEAYALAKIAGLKLCSTYRRQYGADFFSVMPTNLYGPGDNYHPEHSHVLPALLRRFHEAKVHGDPEVAIWGSGNPRREFLHVDDAAAGLLHLMGLECPPDWVNLGTGEDIRIADLAALIAEVVGFAGRLVFDASKPDGTPRKLTDCSLIQSTGWKHRISLRKGLAQTYEQFCAEYESGAFRTV